MTKITSTIKAKIFLIAMLLLVSCAIAYADKQIFIDQRYNPGTNYDTNDDGIESMNSIVDLTVRHTTFNFDAPRSNLCSRWEVVSLDNLASTTICFGSQSCCNYISLAPSSGSWDDVFYLNYGAYGATARNTVAARVIYVGSITNNSGVFPEVAYSNWSSLPVTFIDTMPPQVTDKGPSGTISATTANLSVTTNENAVCKYSLSDDSYGLMGSTFTTTGSARHIQALSRLKDGENRYYVSCRDTANNAMQESEEVTFIVDTTAPLVTSQQPQTKVFTDYTVLNITTNEDALCKYSTQGNIPYASMPSTFEITLGAFHSQELTQLSEGKNTYYIKCKDNSGNIATKDYNASFFVDVAPTAIVTLSETSPLTAGTIEVTLTTTKDVKPTPTLSYALDGQSDINIPLTGSGRVWTGYMIIYEGDKNQIGSFTFSGTSMSGNTGMVITKGSVFLVDTGTPNSVSELIAKRGDANGYVSLRWYYESDEIQYFKIYRSTSSGVKYLDYYDNVSREFYLDTGAAAGDSYYYKVSVVDKGGNEGPLSSEVSVGPADKKAAGNQNKESNEMPTPESTASSQLPAELAKKVDDFVAGIDRLIGELQAASKKFKNSNIKEVEDLELANAVAAKKQEIEALKEQAKQLKSRQLTSAELDNELQSISDQIDEIKKKVPKDISVEVKKQSKNAAEEYVVQLLMSELLTATQLDKMEESQKKEFFARSIGLQNSVDISTTAKLIKIAYMDDTYDEKTLIEKEVTVKGTEGLKNVLLIESIPKSMAESLNDITFKDTDYGIIKQDPIVMWNYDRLNKITIKYIINNRVDINSIGDIQSAVVFNPATMAFEKEADKGSVISGMVTAVKSGSGSLVGIIVGVVVTGGLLGYYFVRVRGSRKHKEPVEGQDGSGKTSPIQGDKSDNIDQMLHEANRRINSNNLAEAKRLYMSVYTAYDKLDNVSMVEKKRIHDSISRLYHKLLLSMKIKEAQACAQLNETANLKYIINNMADLYSRLDNSDLSGEEMEFMDKAREVYEEYASTLRLI